MTATSTSRHASRGDGGDRLTDANLKKQNIQNGDDYSEDEIERRKREYSADIYVYTKGLCESMGMKARPLANGSIGGTESDSSILSLSSLSLNSNSASPAVDDLDPITPKVQKTHIEVANSVGAVPAIH